MGINLAEVTLRHGVCALNLSKPQEALKSLLESRKLNPDTFDVNFYLGKALVEQKEYDKAIPLLRKALMVNKEVPEIYKYLGLALYHNHNFKESLPYLKRALDVSPDDKELLFSMADAMKEAEIPFETSEGPYGLTVDSVHGIGGVFGVDAGYWGFFVNGEYCNYGISQQPVEDGDAFEIIYTKAE